MTTATMEPIVRLRRATLRVRSGCSTLRSEQSPAHGGGESEDTMATATMELEEQAGEATSELTDLERLRNVIVPDANGSNGAEDDDNPHGDESDADTDSYPHDAYLAIREALMPGKTRKPFGDAKKRTDFDERVKAALGAIASVATILSEEDNEALNAHPSIARLAAARGRNVHRKRPRAEKRGADGRYRADRLDVPA